MANSHIHGNQQTGNSNPGTNIAGAENPRIKNLRDQLAAGSANNQGNGIGNDRASSRLGELGTEIPPASVPINDLPPANNIPYDNSPPIIQTRDLYKDQLDIDHDGNVSDNEIVDYELKRRQTNGVALNFGSDQAALDAIATVDAIDKNDDGIISSIESLSSILSSKLNKTDILEDSLDEMVLKHDNQFTTMKEALKRIKLDGPSDIGTLNNEMQRIILILRAAGCGNSIDFTQVTWMKDNPQLAKMINAINIGDANSDGAISDDEAINLSLLSRQDIGLDRDMASRLIATNPNYRTFSKIINLVDFKSDGVISDDEATQIMQQLDGFDDTTIAYIKKIVATNPKYAYLGLIR